MLRKSLIIGSLCLSSIHVALANGGSIEPKHDSGYFYGGIFLGSDFGIFNTKTNTSIPIVGQNPAFQEDLSLLSKYEGSAAGLEGGFLAGYNFLFNRINLGLEAFVEGSSARGISDRAYHITNTIGSYNTLFSLKSKIEVPFSTGLSLVPAYELSHGTTLLARIGVKFTKFQYSADTSLKLVPANNSLPDLSLSQIRIDKFEPGIQYGLGLQSSLISAFDIRLEYDRTEYNDFKRSSTPTILSNQNNVQISLQTSAKLEPAAEEFKVALIYHPHGVNNNEFTSNLCLANGFYLGIFGSRDIANIDAKVNHQWVDFSPALGGIPELVNNTQRFHWNADGYDGGGLIGYDMHFSQRYVVGFEFFGEGSSVEEKYFIATPDSNQSATVNSHGNLAAGQGKVDITHSIGLSILPGIMLTDKTSLFARMGWVYSQFDFSSNSTTVFSNATDSLFNRTFVGNQLKINRDKSGGEIGIGLSTMLNQHLGFRMEYDARFYGEFSKTLSPQIVPSSKINDESGPFALGTSASLRPVVGRFSLGAIYHF